MNNDATSPLISIVLPRRNEAAAIGTVINEIRATLKTGRIAGEIIVADSSTDGSGQIASKRRATVISHGKEGYGNACRIGVAAASGQYVILMDADGSYDASDIPACLAALQAGYDFVIGNRFAGTIEPGAMPWLQRTVGRFIFSSAFRVLFGKKIGDVHCGLRGISRKNFSTLSLQTTGMEFASEMVVKSFRRHLRIQQLPVHYRPRLGQSKLKTIVDGWRHLRFILLYSPTFLFTVPGLALLLAGGAAMVAQTLGSQTDVNETLQFRQLIIASLLTIIGYQLVLFGIFAKTYAITHLGEHSTLMDWVHRHVTLEKIVAGGGVMLLLGLWRYVQVLPSGLPPATDQIRQMSESVAALTLTVLGVQTIFSSFMLSILGIKEK